MKKRFFRLPDGREASLFTLKNAQGTTAEISDFGGVVYRLRLPDRDGVERDVVLGYADPAQYLVNDPHFGGLIGRVANRISNSRFFLDGVEYKLIPNNGLNSLHGGDGFDQRLWQVTGSGADYLQLSLLSPDGDAGYPGELRVEVIYRLTADNALTVEMRAVTTSPTVVNMTQHSYFNLSGEDSGSLLDQEVAVYSHCRQEVDIHLIPTGRTLPTDGTRYDLGKFRPFAELFKKFPHGLDDNYIIGPADGMTRPVAAAYSPATGIRLDVDASDCAIQLYTGGALNGSDLGKSGKPYGPLSGFCLEPQGWIDAVNRSAFPSIRLDPGEAYFRKIEYRFSIK